MDIEKEVMNKNELESILENHKKWLVGNPDGERADLRMADLRRANLHMADLDGANLHMADLDEANLRMADLRRANLRRANLRRANLHGADLHGADLHGADLHGADLDYSAWPLWCGSLDVKVDRRIVAQLAYHFCRLDCDDPEYLTARKALTGLANQFHRVKEFGEIEETENDDD